MFETANLHVIWRDQDPDKARKVAAVMEACAPIKAQQSPLVLSHSGGKPRNIVIDQEVDIWAPDLFDHMIDNYHNETVTCEGA